MDDGRIIRRGRGTIAVEVNVNASDIFNERERLILGRIIRETVNNDTVTEIAKTYNVTDERAIQMIAKIFNKLNYDGALD